jgi:integrase
VSAGVDIVPAIDCHRGRDAGRPETCGDVELRAFIAHEVEQGFHINTVNFHLRCIKPIYTWCWHQRIINGDEYLRIRAVRPPRGSTQSGQPRPYKRHEVQRFYVYLDKRFPESGENMVRRFAKGQSKYSKVWRHATHLQAEAIVSLALFSGMRASEIRFADMDDVHPDNDYIVARGKSSFGERQGHRELPDTEQSLVQPIRRHLRGAVNRHHRVGRSRRLESEVAHKNRYARFTPLLQLGRATQAGRAT